MRALLLIVVWLLSHPAHLIASTWMLIGALTGRPRAWRIALGYDYLSNAATGGDPRELISVRAYRAMQAGHRWGCVLCRLLDYVQKNHCAKAYEAERARTPTPPPSD
jgi:hypothetical protein